VPLNQLDAKLRLQQLDLPAERRLRDMQNRSCTAEVLVRSQHFKVSQLP
jgi:hypothetical protein